MKQNLKPISTITLIILFSIGCKKEFEVLPKERVIATVKRITPSNDRSMISFNNSEKLKKAFNNYAGDFGITGAYTSQAKAKFEDFLAGHVKLFSNEAIQRTYQGVSALHHYDNRHGTRLNVITHKTTKELLDVRRLTELEYKSLNRRKSLH